MLSDPRSIALMTDLLQPQLRYRTEALQSFYAKLVTEPRLDYQNFNLQQGGAHLSTVRPASSPEGDVAQSVLSFLPDRIQVREDWPRCSLDDYVEKVLRALSLAMAELAIPVVSVVQVTVRALVVVHGHADSRAFLRERFDLGVGEGGGAFGREPNLLGVRLAFPASPEDPAVHNVRIESFGRDPRSLFLEETRVISQPIRPEGVEEVGRAVRAAYEFLTRDVPAFLKA